MKWLNDIKYVCNNPRRWKRWISDIILDLKYGGKFLGGNMLNAIPALGRAPSTSSDYEAISTLFSQIEIKPSDVLVDVGCGKGRVFNWALNNGIENQLIGIDVDKNVAAFTMKRLQRYPQIKIITGDICDTGIMPGHGTIFYIFNPFSEKIVQHFADQVAVLSKQVVDKSRPLILYYNCIHITVFESNPIWKIKKLGSISVMNLPAAIISLNMD